MGSLGGSRADPGPASAARSIIPNGPLQPIAIIGYACRLPGQVSSPDDLWEMCTRRRSGWSPIPPDRFCAEAYHHPYASKVGTFNPAGGYFLQNDISRFDAPFFNITAQEARSLDPQQRQLLECAFEALESAGLSRETCSGNKIGVFVGGNFSDYEVNNTRDVETIPMYQATGCAQALQSNRISYHFNLRGPSMTVDTACSSSLVALHYAVQSLRSGDASAALVGGCRLNVLPDLFVSMSMSQLFNDEGKTFAFDDRAQSGFARGEGVGMVVLKPLDDAMRDGDPIRAVIANTGVNQDGKTQGITQPNGQAQEALIRDVYRGAGLDTQDCGFVEMHGTGTKVGDPIESHAVYQALAQGRLERDPLFIGSVKSNVGHLEGASGVVSVIKAAMMLEKDLILPNADFRTPNKKIPFEQWNMKVIPRTRPWPRGKKYVSVSNYGFGGTNAHAVLQKAPLPTTKREVEERETEDPRRKLVLISASSTEALKTRIKDLGVYFEQHPEVFEKRLFGNLVYTLGSRRSHLPYRLALSATSQDDLGIQLAQRQANPPRVTGSPSIGFVFTGQGAQWARMGVLLMDVYPIVASVMEAADACLRKLGASFSLLEEMRKDEESSQINAPHISQPACTALQVALTTLLGSWGIHPAAVVGHSSGEIAAAFATGAFNLESTMALAYHRGQTTLTLKEKHPSLKGAMLAVGIGEETVRPMLQLLRAGYATIACVNSPSSVTVSGDKEAVVELEQILQERQLFCRRLKVDVAYHSSHMKRVSSEYLQAIQCIHPSTVQSATFFSSVSGSRTETTTLSPAYWIANLTSTVLFPHALGEMCSGDERPQLLIEIGPHSALKGPVLDTLKSLGQSIPYASALIRKQDPTECVLNVAATAYMRGLTLNMNSINFPRTGAALQSVLTDLPPYPWQHGTRFWHEPRIVQKHRLRDGKRHDVLGLIANYSNDLEPTWRNIVHLDEVPWLRDHRMQGMPVFPIAGYLSMALEASSRHAKQRRLAFSRFELREVMVVAALVLSHDSGVEVTTSLRPHAEGLRGYSSTWEEFRICSWEAHRGWTEHCRGLIRVVDEKGGAPWEESEVKLGRRESQISAIKTAATQKIDSSTLYQALEALGAGYGPTFQGMEGCFADARHSYAGIYVRDTKSVMPKGIESGLSHHPAFIDAFIHLVWPILGPGRVEQGSLYMPTSIQHAVISCKMPTSPGEHMLGYCTSRQEQIAAEPVHFDLFGMAQGSGDLLLALDNLVMSPVNRSETGPEQQQRKLCYKVEWQPFPMSTVTTNGHSESMNGHVEAVNGRSETMNGNTKTNGATVVHDAAANGNTSILTNGSSKRPLDLHIAVFGKPNEVTDALCRTRAAAMTPDPLICDLEDLDGAGKNVIILESGTRSLRHMDPSLLARLKNVLLGASKILWVYRTDVPDSQMSVGLARSVRSESVVHVTLLGLDPLHRELSTTALINVIGAMFPKPGVPACEEFEFKMQDSRLMIPRVVEDTVVDTFVGNETIEAAIFPQRYDQPGRRLKIQVGTVGQLDTLFFVDDLPPALGADEVEIQVKATGVNFKDVVVAMGQLSQPYIGIECSGVVSSVGQNVKHVRIGQRVMAMPEGAYSTYARCRETSVYPIPADLSFEEAASIPVVFCTAYYGLFDLANLQSGERVLIHAGAGGVGQAAIMLAQLVGADVFVTVGSSEKRSFLMQHYSLPANRILYSRDTSFASAVRALTEDEGVDVVLNSLAGDLLRESWNCLAPFGRFIEIGKADITKNTRLEMLPFENNVAFASVDLTKVAQKRPKLMRRLLSDVSRLITDGSVRPISPVIVYPISEIQLAFRTLQAGKNTGKIVVVPREGCEVKAVSPKTPVRLLQEHGTYILVGGTGGLGRAIAGWMASRGAKHIVLVSRSGASTDDVKTTIRELELLGTQVIVKACDVGSMESVTGLVKEQLKGLPPVRGIIHGAMVLRDALFENLAADDFEAVTRCKVDGAWNLHLALSESPLDFFIALSSVAGIVGNRGQSAYAAANAFLDGFMAYRRSLNLCGVSIDLAAIADAGYLADSDPARRQEVLKNIGSQALNSVDVFALLAAAISGKLDDSCNGQCVTGLSVEDTTAEPFWIHDPRFAALRTAAQAGLGGVGLGNRQASLRTLLATASSREIALDCLQKALVIKLADVLTMTPDDIGDGVSISSLGLDSLVAIEIRNWIARETDANVQVLELLSGKNIKHLAEMVLAKSKLVQQLG